MALTHGYVTGELIYSRADGPDGDRLPDEIPATDVKLTFTPAVKQFVDPDGRLVVLDAIPAAVMADGSVTGDVEEDGTPKVDATPGLWLVVGKYNVAAKGHYRDFTITVTDAHTEATPLVLGEAIGYVPPTTTVQAIPVPPGAADGQVLGWQGGLAWVTGGGGGGDPLTSYATQVATLTDYPEVFPADLSGTATAAQGAKADTAVQPAAIADFITAADVPDAPTWQNISGKPAVVAEGTSETAARDAIGAGTSNLELGTGSTTAKRGDYTPTVGDVPNLPASKVTTGTFADARIPTLDIAKTSGLQSALDATVSTTTTGLQIDAGPTLPAPGNPGRIFIVVPE